MSWGRKKRMLFEIISWKNLNKNKTATATKEMYLLHLYSIFITAFPILDFHFFLLWFILHEMSTGIFARLIQIHAMAITKACIVRFVYFWPWLVLQTLSPVSIQFFSQKLYHSLFFLFVWLIVLLFVCLLGAWLFGWCGLFKHTPSAGISCGSTSAGKHWRMEWLYEEKSGTVVRVQR